MKPSGDIYSTLFSENAVLQKLSSIFVDSMVVDNDLNITVVSENILSILGFTMAELRGKSLDYLSDEEDLVAAIRKQLFTGHFSERRFTLLTKKRNKITFGISGFYLGLISDINGRIILRMSTPDNSEEVNHKLQAKILEMDNFVYRAGHDLRGPLATIKGLVNLMKIRENNDEVDRVMQLIEAHANQLDERLFQLMFLTYSGQDVSSSPEIIDFNAIETRLRQTIEKNAFIDFLELHFHAPSKHLRGLKTEAVMGLFENLLLYILSLPMHDFQRQIFFRIQQEENNLHITIGCSGFQINDKLRTAFDSPDFTYADMMRYPEMINFYAAQKIAMQLHSRIRVNILADDKQQIILTIPVPLSAAERSPIAAT